VWVSYVMVMRINIMVLPIFVIISLLSKSISAEQDSGTMGQTIDAQVGTGW
jgi:hypothetical protein